MAHLKATMSKVRGRCPKGSATLLQLAFASISLKTIGPSPVRHRSIEAAHGMSRGTKIRTKQSDPSSAGFTLLEIMIAIAIVGGLLVTLIYTLNYHLGIAERQEFLTVASLLAREKMGEMEKKPESMQGDFPAPYSNYHFVTQLKESPFPDMSQISVVVSDGKDNVKLVELIQNQQ